MVQRAAKIDGPNGQTVQHVEETLRNGRVMRRVEEITTVEGTHVVRIRRIYELVNGALELLAETRQVVQTLAPSPSPASPPAREP